MNLFAALRLFAHCPAMAYLIDGYNLLHVTGIFGRGRGPHGLERSRKALLNFLAASLSPSELSQTTVVFDAAAAPPGLPRTQVHQGITVRFAANYDDADALIEELIEQHSAPRRLVVVSSDHRLHRAARRRKAKPIDSEDWYSQLLRKRHSTARPTDKPDAKPTAPPSEAQVQYWVDEFRSGEPPQGATSPQAEKPKPLEPEDVFNPFPPGYGEDLLEDES
ncbi:MAG: NYN domain-containing protein [Pirellulales bacterium]